MPVTRVTVTGAEELADPEQASAWLEAVAGDARRRGAEVRSATLLVNRALHALRAGAADPLVADVAATRALAIRIGYGTGEELAQGRWTAARELPPPKRGRYEEVEPQSRVAAVLAGRDRVPSTGGLRRPATGSPPPRRPWTGIRARGSSRSVSGSPPSGSASTVDSGRPAIL